MGTSDEKVYTIVEIGHFIYWAGQIIVYGRIMTPIRKGPATING
jgi:hypothetical protein